MNMWYSFDNITVYGGPHGGYIQSIALPFPEYRGDVVVSVQNGDGLRLFHFSKWFLTWWRGYRGGIGENLWKGPFAPGGWRDKF